MDYERNAGGYNLRNGQYKMRDMMSEEYRLSTFNNHWPHHSTPNLTGLQMARAGFFYEGQSDKVTCPYCRQWLNRWEKEDVPLVEHKTKFPHCKFVRGEVEEEKVGNDLIEDMDTDQDEQKKWDAAKQKDPNIIGEPGHPHNADKQRRIETFRNGTGCSKTAEALAEAGFFSTGTGDEVTCFYCSVTLNNWGGTDIPWVEHARESPKCPFVEEECGRFYINQVSGDIDREFVENLRQEAKAKGHSDHDITQALHNNGEPFWSEEDMREAVEALDYQRLAVTTQAAEHDEEEEIQDGEDGLRRAQTPVPAYRNASQYNQQHDRIDALEVELNDARQQIGHQQGQIANLEGQIANLQRQFGDFRRAVFGQNNTGRLPEDE